ncbi:phytanoyl-CoA dioxygenase family protein [Parasphingopyxis marina]|uniref:Phytanoyl-CoA dioxygenase family protein n=1 Tax=Parasphingopyxis marina TaxID=2761622 RepID=A0A842HXQ7_9SPHN|nr:phytanoyl-CoA dioxygenase family protein [Parasphingopyxis marina]MBC2778948.1 phytanoyl-CoA dioxygenase family protein [Parasphingopyxis marina]
MEIGNWSSMAGMDDVYRQVRGRGLETNIAELETFGFTVIPREKTGAPAGFAEQLLDKLQAIIADEDALTVELNKHEDTKPAAGRQLFHLLARDQLFIDAMMNPVVRLMASYTMGLSYRLAGLVAFLKDGPARPTAMHSDSVGVPPPLPAYSTVCNVSWILTDYTVENGTLGFVPGSHRYRRHPTQAEQPQFAGGALPDDTVAPLIAPPGSLAVFTGNTWHCTFPKKNDVLRAHIATSFARNFVYPPESFDDLPDEIVAGQGPDFARIIGRQDWQGYRSEGPKLENMALVHGTYQSQYG